MMAFTGHDINLQSAPVKLQLMLQDVAKDRNE
jgi:hypothetical protein